MKNIQSKVNDIHQKLVKALSEIKEIPEDFLPHMVFVEEEKDGMPVYNRYSLTEILPCGNCILANPVTDEKEERDLSEINIDWLVTLWIRYNELIYPKKVYIEEKELCVFTYPLERFERNASNEEIITAWENTTDESLPVNKYTPDEFAELINDEMLNDRDYWVRFIEY